MKFGKTYSSYLEKEAQKLLPGFSWVEFKRLKKLLKGCPHSDARTVHSSSTHPCLNSPTRSVIKKRTCAACDAQFFPFLLKDVASFVDCFTKSSRQLRSLHLSSGPKKMYLRFKTKIRSDTANMVGFANILVSYGCMNALAVRKILKKYDKIHRSLCGRAFQTKLQAMRVELFQSPWLVELGALAINLTEPKVPRLLCQGDEPSQAHPPPFWTCNHDCEKHTLSYLLPDTSKLEFNLQCSVCLDIVFDPVALGCGHIFCRSCVCAAASVPAFLGVEAARRGAKCPLCRQAGVYTHALYLKELAVLIEIRFQEYFHDRKLVERKQRLKEAKEYWESEAIHVMGF